MEAEDIMHVRNEKSIISTLKPSETIIDSNINLLNNMNPQQSGICTHFLPVVNTQLNSGSSNMLLLGGSSQLQSSSITKLLPGGNTRLNSESSTKLRIGGNKKLNSGSSTQLTSDCSSDQQSTNSTQFSYSRSLQLPYSRNANMLHSAKESIKSRKINSQEAYNKQSLVVLTQNARAKKQNVSNVGEETELIKLGSFPAGAFFIQDMQSKKTINGRNQRKQLEMISQEKPVISINDRILNKTELNRIHCKAYRMKK